MSWLDGEPQQGQQFTSTVGPSFAQPVPIGGGGIGSVSSGVGTGDTFTSTVDSGFSVVGDRWQSPLSKIRSPLGASNEAILSLGCVPDADLPFMSLPGEAFRTAPSDPEDPEEPQSGGVDRWTEEERQEKVIKVASEDDPDTYIKVKVAIKSLVDAPILGCKVLITWKDTGQQPPPGGGA